MSEHDKSGEAPKSSRRSKSGEGFDGGSAMTAWEQLLDESTAWRSLTETANLQFTDDGFHAVPGELDRVQAGAIMNAAEIILEGRGYRVRGGTEPALNVRVVEE